MNVSIVRAMLKGQKPQGVPCQDAYAVLDTKDFSLVAIADGLGSKPKSQAGAQIACHAVVRCCRETLATGDRRVLATQIPSSWKARVVEKNGSPRDYATTCAFMFLLKKENKVIVGSKGDSLVALQIDFAEFSIPFNENKDFINETDAFDGHGSMQMKILELSYEKSVRFLLATDGISDEIADGRINEFCNYLCERYSRIKSKNQNYFLRKELRNSLETKNSDDKTILFGWAL